MSYTYSGRSITNLNTCHPKLQLLMLEAIKHRDISVIEGHRGEEKQNEYFQAGKSKKQWPDSKHNKLPSLALDAIPCPTKPEDWNNREFWIEWGSWLRGLADGLGIPIVCGIDWDRDHSSNDQTFFDGPHIELKVT